MEQHQIDSIRDLLDSGSIVNRALVTDLLKGLGVTKNEYFRLIKQIIYKKFNGFDMYFQLPCSYQLNLFDCYTINIRFVADHIDLFRYTYKRNEKGRTVWRDKRLYHKPLKRIIQGLVSERIAQLKSFISSIAADYVNKLHPIHKYSPQTWKQQDFLI